MMVVRVTTAKIEPATTAQSSIATASFVATTGNLIVVVVRCGTNGLVSSVTDTAGNTYVEAISSTGQDPKIFIYYAKNITGHATNVVTVNFSPSAEFSWACAVQYSGLDTVSPVDAIDVKTGTGVSDLVSDPFSTAREGVVVLGASQATFTTYTAGADFTLIDGAIGNNVGDNFGGVEERITTGSLSSYTAHITSGATNAYTVGLVAFKAVIAATGPMLFRGRTFSFFDDDEVNRFEFWSPIAAEATVHNRAASLDAVGDIVAAGQSFSIFSRSAVIDATASISATGISVLERSTELSVTAAVTVSGVQVVERAASLNATAAIESSAESFSVFARAATFNNTAAITVAAMREVLRAASYSATATIETSAQSFLVVERSVLVNVTSSVEAAGVTIRERQASLNVTTTIVVDGQTEQLRQVVIDATAVITVSGVVVPPGVVEHERSASLSVTGDIATTAQFFSILSASVEFTSTATITTTGLSISARLVMIETTSAITVSHQRELQRSAQLAVTGVIAVSGAVVTGAAIERAAAFNAVANITVSSRYQHPTPPRRTFVVQLDQRTLTVTDARTYVVAD